MVIVMEMSTGRVADPEPAYDDEILDAGWLPRPEPGLQQVEHCRTPERHLPPPEDIDAFLAAMYRNQE
ncbi:hypothetical protein [Pseudothauera lacus]|uniref:Uncharacterized protein n=1 Tax=Pseudothauera lacus TaxID=2136175 RepID=A0A2T4IDQ7_9RHOO|nr:hypothetical protein [Pseudothauera lacus]PTD95888.1 hypothetical protein C8261_12745 [Pseudothauera lacus]